MLDKTGFDKWSGTYDENVEQLSKGYPFEGYYDVLGFVQSKVKVSEGTKILDLGIGTGLLTNDLYNRGAHILGVDFSEHMIKEALAKMPRASFLAYDFNDALPKAILEERFDYIVSSYAIHHVTDERKVELIKALMGCLKDNGVMLIADVAFETQGAMEGIKNESDQWDEDEYYMVGETIVERLRREGIHSEYIQISMCGGILFLLNQ